MIHSGGRPGRNSTDPARLADAIVEKVGKTIVLALPLGLGKANHIANALYAKAVADPSIRLTIFTALTLEPPRREKRAGASLPRSDRAARVRRLSAARLCGGDPRKARCRRTSRSMSSSSKPGSGSNSPYAQQHYISANYTHALRYVLDRGVNVVAQLVAHRAGEAPRRTA